MTLENLLENTTFNRMFPKKRIKPFYIWDGGLIEVDGSKYHDTVDLNPDDYDILILKLSANVTHRTKPKDREQVFESLEKQIKYAIEKGIKVIVVASGAYAYGSEHHPEPESDSDRADIYRHGQRLLMREFENMTVPVEGFLVTPESMRTRLDRIDTIGRMLFYYGMEFVPVVNVDDVARINAGKELCEEFSSNDVLACKYIASTVKELGLNPLMVMLGSEAGIYELDSYREYADQKVPFPSVIRIIRNSTGLESQIIPERESAKGTGGLSAKLDAIRSATDGGIPVMMAQGFQYRKDALVPECLPVIALLGERYVGTIFKPTEMRGD